MSPRALSTIAELGANIFQVAQLKMRQDETGSKQLAHSGHESYAISYCRFASSPSDEAWPDENLIFWGRWRKGDYASGLNERPVVVYESDE